MHAHVSRGSVYQLWNILGLVIGYLTMILNGLSLITCLLAIVGLSVYSCEDIIEMVKERHPDEESLRVFTEYCASGKIRKQSGMFLHKQACTNFFFQFSLLFASSLHSSLLVLLTLVGCVSPEQ